MSCVDVKSARNFAFALTAVFSGAFSAVAQTNLADTVSGFYPPSLLELSEQLGTRLSRNQCFAVYDTTASGVPQTIVAAYTDGFQGVIRVLERDGVGFSVVDEPVGLQFVGSSCEVAFVDLDSDGVREIHVSFHVMANSADWVFELRDNRLVNLTPLQRNDFDGGATTQLLRASFVDLDNDGIMEIHTVGEYPVRVGVPPEPDAVYRFSGNSFIAGEPVVGVWMFNRTTGSPRTETVRLIPPKGANGPFSLRIVNGEANGRSRVSSAEVFLAGGRVVGPNDFNQDVAIIDRQIQVNGETDLAVRLSGRPGSVLKILVLSDGWQRN